MAYGIEGRTNDGRVIYDDSSQHFVISETVSITHSDYTGVGNGNWDLRAEKALVNPLTTIPITACKSVDGVWIPAAVPVWNAAGTFITSIIVDTQDVVDITVLILVEGTSSTTVSGNYGLQTFDGSSNKLFDSRWAMPGLAHVATFPDIDIPTPEVPTASFLANYQKTSDYFWLCPDPTALPIPEIQSTNIGRIDFGIYWSLSACFGEKNFNSNAWGNSTGNDNYYGGGRFVPAVRIFQNTLSFSAIRTGAGHTNGMTGMPVTQSFGGTVMGFRWNN